MAPLYKRYIPPKPNKASSTSAPAVEAPEPPLHVESSEKPEKRKRERTDEEVADRKAKKLKKKGVDASNIEQTEIPQVLEDVKSGAKDTSSTNGSAKASKDGPQSEFAHIKDTKKRHRLEKEARKARIAAEKAAKKEESTGLVKTNDTSQEATQDTRQDETEALDGELRKEPSEPAALSKRKKKERRNHGDESTAAEDADLADTLNSTNGEIENPKKAKKSKRKPKNESHEDDDVVEEPESAIPNRNDAESQPKKRRHKLEAVLQEPQETTEAQKADDDEHLKKHGSILKKYQKSMKLAQTASEAEPREEDPSAPKPVLLDLAPLPQPEPAPIEKFVPDDSALPSWLAKPTVVSSDSRSPFSSLKLNPKTVNHLSKLGFREALPVQQALIPLLLPPGIEGAQFPPGTESILPDVAVSAPTGSGKTIAYLLPIIEALKNTKYAGEDLLKALVVVPTRELVLQVAAVAESLAKGSTLRVGMATGSGAFKDEQVKLIKQGRRYDPEEYNNMILKAHRRNYPPEQDSEEFDELLAELEGEDVKMEQKIKDTVTGLVSHVPTYSSAVDILVATHGRLLDHLKSTLGFSLAHLEYLVLDEADKLLDLQYDGFLETVNAELERPRGEDEQDARERFLRGKGAWDERRERRVRKVMLSATMTRDISKLVALKLKRPRMVVVRGSEQQGDDAVDGAMEGVHESSEVFELPPTLREYAVPVGDGSEKPLFLTELLRTRILTSSGNFDGLPHPKKNLDDDSASDDASTSSDSSDSESDPDTSSSDSESDSSSEVSSPPNSAENDTTDQTDLTSSMHPSRTALLNSTSTPPTILIFTSSTETATRLSHFLSHLLPSQAPNIHTLTRTTSKPKLPPFSTTTPIIVISTDRAGRGLDSISTRQITHVIQYDVPRSLTGYVHRVGRTARAGREGEAWTLVEGRQAVWFWKQIGGAEVRGVNRRGAVEKVRIKVEDEGLRERLAEVVEEVRGKVFGGKGKRR